MSCVCGAFQSLGLKCCKVTYFNYYNNLYIAFPIVKTWSVLCKYQQWYILNKKAQAIFRIRTLYLINSLLTALLLSERCLLGSKPFLWPRSLSSSLSHIYSYNSNIYICILDLGMLPFNAYCAGARGCSGGGEEMNARAEVEREG